MSNQDVEMMPVQVERILAAVISMNKEIRIPVAVLLADYSDKQIFIDQKDDDLIFRLVDADEAP